MAADAANMTIDILSISGERIARVAAMEQVVPLDGGSSQPQALAAPADASYTPDRPSAHAAVTVRDLRESLRKTKDIPMSRIQLVCGSDILEDHRLLLQLQPPQVTLVVLTEPAWISDPRWESLLLAASRKADATAVQGVLQRLINPNCVDTGGRTPLFIAAGDGHAGIVKMLQEAEADPNKAKKSGMSPLYAAAQNGHFEVVNMLCDAGVDQNMAQGVYSVTPLFAAAQNGRADVVKLLCMHRADHGKARASGMTPLCIASQHGHLEVVSALCEAGADNNKATLDGDAPLHVASRRGCVEVIRYLCEFRADLEQVDGSGMTPLDIATWGEHEECRAEIERFWRSESLTHEQPA